MEDTLSRTISATSGGLKHEFARDRIFGSIDGNFDRSEGPVKQSVRMSTLDRPLICPILENDVFSQ